MNYTPLIRNKSDYRSLLCYQKAEIIYDLTYYFAHTFLARNDRTVDQMIQAARSGKQNIVEGYADSAASVEMGIKLLNVAKSSLMELLADYEDFLRVNEFPRWEEGSKEYLAMQRLGREDDHKRILDIVRTRPADVVANMAITLIHQADYLLYRFIQSLTIRFEQEGGIKEKMYQTRLKARTK